MQYYLWGPIKYFPLLYLFHMSWASYTHYSWLVWTVLGQLFETVFAGFGQEQSPQPGNPDGSLVYWLQFESVSIHCVCRFWAGRKTTTWQFWFSTSVQMASLAYTWRPHLLEALCSSSSHHSLRSAWFDLEPVEANLEVHHRAAQHWPTPQSWTDATVDGREMVATQCSQVLGNDGSGRE